MKNPIGISPRTATAPRFFGRLAAWGPALVIGGALATVTATTGFVSYTHISALSLDLHQSWKTAHLTPVFIDGQIIIGSAFYMVTTGKQRFLGLLGAVPGLAESLFANWESGISHGLLAASWAVVAAQAFAVSSFLFERWLKVRAQGGGQAAHVRIVTVGCGHGVAEDRDGRIRDAWFHLKDCLGGEPTYRGVGGMLGVHNEIVRQVVMAVADGGGEDEEPAAEPIRYAALNGSGS